MKSSSVLAALVALAVILIWTSAPAAAQRRGDCRGAEATDWRGTMVPPDEPGKPLHVSGRVLDASGAPLAGVRILAYQTDQEGYYSPNGGDESNARLCAVIRTDAEGRYFLKTIRPASYPTGGVPEHIHFELWGDGLERQRRDLQFADDDLVPESRKRELSRTSTVRPVVRDSDGIWRIERDFEVRR